MSHNAYIRPFGVWNANLLVKHDELQSLDLAQFKAINGDDGGTWAPVVPIVVGGAGMTVRLVDANSAENLTVSGNFQASFGGFARFYGETTFRVDSTATVQSGAKWFFAEGSETSFDPGSSLTVSGNFATIAAGGSSTFGADCFFNAFCDFERSVVFGADGDVGFQGPTTFDGQANVRGGMVMQNNLAMSGAGTVLWRVVSGSMIDHTYSASQVDEVIVQGNPGGAVIYSIDNAGAAEGKRIRFSFFGAPTGGLVGIVIQKLLPTPTVLFALGGVPGSDAYVWAEIVFLGGTWVRSAGDHVRPA